MKTLVITPTPEQWKFLVALYDKCGGSMIVVNPKIDYPELKELNGKFVDYDFGGGPASADLWVDFVFNKQQYAGVEITKRKERSK